MKIIGLTGPSGAGKTDVANIFRERGFLCLDADKIYKEIVLKDDSYKKVLVEAFSGAILDKDGEVDRKILGGIVFSNPEKLSLLNSLAHKRVRSQIFKIIEENPEHKIALIDAPQLFEGKLSEDCDKIVSVIAPPEERIKRIMIRDHISRDAALLRISAQYSDDFFKEHSDFMIENDKDRESLLKKARDMVDKILCTLGE